MHPYTGDLKQKKSNDKTGFVYYTFTPCPLMKGNFFELDNKLLDMLAETHHAFGLLKGRLKYALNKESFESLCLLLECCYSRMIDYDLPSFYNTLVGDGIDYITPIVSAYRYSIGKKITDSVVSDVFKIVLYGIENKEKVAMRKKQIFMLNTVTNMKVYNPIVLGDIIPAMDDISTYLF